MTSPPPGMSASPAAQQLVSNLNQYSPPLCVLHCCLTAFPILTRLLSPLPTLYQRQARVSGPGYVPVRAPALVAGPVAVPAPAAPVRQAPKRPAKGQRQAPKRPPVAVPVPAPVAVPVPAPVAVPVPAPVAIPAPAPVAIPVPAPVAVPAPAPVPSVAAGHATLTVR